MERLSICDYRYNVLSDEARVELEERVVKAVGELETCKRTMVSRCYGDHWEVSEEGITGDAVLCDVVRMYEAYCRAMEKESDPIRMTMDDMVTIYAFHKHGHLTEKYEDLLSYYAKLSVILEDLVTGYWMDNYS